MKTVAVLISNYNGFEAIQLCIESIRRHTDYPHKIIVYDSNSGFNICDYKYLMKAQELGWIELIAGKTLSHGEALNHLLNERCEAEFDYAAILDNDIYIKETGWLEPMIKEAEKDGVLVVCDYWRDFHYNHSDCFGLWFGLINLKAYRDNMQVDWRPSYGDIRSEPFESMKKGMVPAGLTDPRIVCDVGSKLLIKTLTDNPKGYKMATVPESVREKYHHWGTMSRIFVGEPGSLEKAKSRKEWLEKSMKINAALMELRK